MLNQVLAYFIDWVFFQIKLFRNAMRTKCISDRLRKPCCWLPGAFRPSAERMAHLVRRERESLLGWTLKIVRFPELANLIQNFVILNPLLGES